MRIEPCPTLWVDIPNIYAGWVGIVDGEMAIPSERSRRGTFEGRLGQAADDMAPYTFVLDRSRWAPTHRLLYAPAPPAAD